MTEGKKMKGNKKKITYNIYMNNIEIGKKKD